MAARRKVTVVNVSSLAATSPFEYWSLYCAGKSARDMFHKCIAHEAEKRGLHSQVRVLNYAPGPLDTRMQAAIREDMPAGELRDAFLGMHRENKLISPLDSARVMVRLLEVDKYDNGAHVDYYEVVQPSQ